MAKTDDLTMLIKLLGMTSVDNDNQALMAIRKANLLVRDQFNDWESLLRGKITIIQDPFQVAPPAKVPTRPPPPPVARPAPRPTPTFRSPPNPTTSFAGAASGGGSGNSGNFNRFAGMTALHGHTYPIKDALKALGAIYDGPTKTWYVPDSKMPDALDLLANAPKPPQKARRGRSREVSLEELDDAF